MTFERKISREEEDKLKVNVFNKLTWEERKLLLDLFMERDNLKNKVKRFEERFDKLNKRIRRLEGGKTR